MIKRVLIIGFAMLGLVWGGAGRAQSITGAIRVVEKELPLARIEVTGKGYPPKRDISEIKKRLLAKRAATVDAYRVMSAILNGVSGYIAGGAGYIQTSGFIKGAEISNLRYFANGKVEVDLVLPVNFLVKGVNKNIDWDSIVRDISRKGYPVYYIEKPVRQISEEEWLEIQGK